MLHGKKPNLCHDGYCNEHAILGLVKFKHNIVCLELENIWFKSGLL